MRYVPDTSVIINGQLLKYLNTQTEIESIIISRIVLAEIEHMANQAKTVGMTALEELRLIRDFCAEHGIQMIIDGNRPTAYQIKGAPSGELDARIRELADEYQAVLITSDRVQAEMGEMEGLAVVFLKEPKKSIGIRIEDYFDKQTMSIHLRENNPPLGKKGAPGDFILEKVSDEVLSRTVLEELAKDIIERASREADSFIESDQQGVTVVQLKNIRIIITRPPFSDKMEITAVRPILKRTIKDYKLTPELLERIEKKAEGIIIAGAPGAGKSTFATAVAEFYADMNKIVKTFENPRDLQVDDRITQLSGFDGDISESADLVLLMRPDYVIYDELRKTKDFATYADLRLAGIGLIGVVHATQAIEGIQRFIKRVDLGIIPSIVDTIIFIEKGEVGKVYTLSLKVKVPTGMTERDLTRPVVEVRDFYSKTLEYEIYSFGEQIVVAPVESIQKRPKKLLGLQSQIRKILKKYDIELFDYNVGSANQLTLYVTPEDKPRVIGRDGKTIAEIERKLGMSITVKTLEHEEAEFLIDAYLSKKHIHLVFPEVCIGKDVIIQINGTPLVQLTVGKTGEIKIAKDTEIGRILIEAYNNRETISAIL
ncbi:MAG: PINc/VapC family ATPase [Candidatus Heimdallarchaeaceae archaeon]